MPSSEFVSTLVRMNRLDQVGFDRFIFFQGMLFNTLKKWWGDSGIRKSSHEGVDLCFFKGHYLQKFRLDETIRIPTIFAGKIVQVMDDFMGKTVITSHVLNDECPAGFFVFYAHIQPDSQIKVGDILEHGEPFATIADISGIPAPIPPHLHISMAWEKLLPPVDRLSWEFLNRVDRSVFIDPLICLNTPYSILTERPGKKTIDQFTPISLFLKERSEESHAESSNR
jgi:hypothetical protein